MFDFSGSREARDSCLLFLTDNHLEDLSRDECVDVIRWAIYGIPVPLRVAYDGVPLRSGRPSQTDQLGIV